VATGDRIRVRLTPLPAVDSFAAQAIPLDIVYEDDHILAVNKPAGMVVHPSAGHSSNTLVNALLYHCGQCLSNIQGQGRPGIVHRLDKATSGILLVAKTNQAHIDLQRQFAQRLVHKSYLALVFGRLKQQEQTIDCPIGRDNRERKRISWHTRHPRQAQTHVRSVYAADRYTLVEARPKTGRTHQIRVHLKYIGHPVVGDTVYAARRTRLLAGALSGGPDLRLMLHSRAIHFLHPNGHRPVELSCPLPEDFQSLQETLLPHG